MIALRLFTLASILSYVSELNVNLAVSDFQKLHLNRKQKLQICASVHNNLNRINSEQ